jgi:hypothetical protein
MRATSPFEIQVRYELEDAEGGTLARIRTRGGGTAFYKLAGPLLSRMVRRSVANDLANLKEYLDARADQEAAPAQA